MKTRVADELGDRDDLATQIGYAISTAIDAYQKERFRFNEKRTLTFNTVASQEFYTSADNADIPLIKSIDYITMRDSTTSDTVFQMSPESIVRLEVISDNATNTGRPFEYAYYNKSLRLWPVPDGVYPIRVAGHIAVAEPASDTEASNPWMIDAERLIRSRAKLEIALHVSHDAEMAQAMSAAIADAVQELKGEFNKLSGTGIIRPMQF